jgi:predicted oxidoreductase
MISLNPLIDIDELTNFDFDINLPKSGLSKQNQNQFLIANEVEISRFNKPLKNDQEINLTKLRDVEINLFALFSSGKYDLGNMNSYLNLIDGLKDKNKQSVISSMHVGPSSAKMSQHSYTNINLLKE